MQNSTKESIKDEEENRRKYPTKVIVITVLVIGVICMVLAYMGAWLTF